MRDVFMPFPTCWVLWNVRSCGVETSSYAVVRRSRNRNTHFSSGKAHTAPCLAAPRPARAVCLCAWVCVFSGAQQETSHPTHHHGERDQFSVAFHRKLTIGPAKKRDLREREREREKERAREREGERETHGEHVVCFAEVKT